MLKIVILNFVAKADISGIVGNLFIKEGNDIAAKETLFTILK